MSKYRTDLFQKKLLKVAHVVNIKLGFTDLIILIKWYKIQYLNQCIAPFFPRNQVICLKNWNFWRAPSAIDFNTFCWNFTLVYVLPMYTKECSRFFQKPGLILFWQISQVLNKIKKIRSTLFVDIGKQETCEKFQQKLFKSMVVGARQLCQFFKQNTWFLESNRTLPKFLYGIWHCLISITKL